MRAGDYADTQSSMATSLNGVENLVIALSQKSGVDYEVMSAIKSVFQRAIGAGHGDEDVASLIEVFAQGWSTRATRSTVQQRHGPRSRHRVPQSTRS